MVAWMIARMAKAVGWENAQSPRLQDTTLQMPPIHASLNYLIPPMHGPVPLFPQFLVAGSAPYQVQHLQKTSLTPFKVPSPMCYCYRPLSPQASIQGFAHQFQEAPIFCIHSTHTGSGTARQRLWLLPAFSCRHWVDYPGPSFRLKKTFPDLKP